MYEIRVFSSILKHAQHEHSSFNPKVMGSNPIGRTSNNRR